MLPPTLILAGGKGTRAAPYLGDTPKFLAPVGDTTVAGYLLPWLASFNPRYVALLLSEIGGATQIQSRITQNLVDFTFVDDHCVGTVAALRRARRFLAPTPEGVLLLNGDTLLDADLLLAYREHRRHAALVTELTLGPTPAGARFVSAAALRLLIRAAVSNVEEAIPLLCSPMTYPVRDFVDVGTEAGWRRAQEWV